MQLLLLWTIFIANHTNQALGIKKAICKKSTIADIYLLDYVLPQVAKLSRALQTENLDLPMIYSLLDATLHSIDDAVLSSSNWVLEPLEAAQDLETAIEERITQEDISEKIGQCFIHQLRDNITSHFTSSDVVSSFSIFDPRKVPATSSPLFSLYGEGAIDTLIDHYAQNFQAETVHGVQFVKEGIISLDVRTEWKTYRQFLSKQPKDNLKTQLQELATNDTLIALLPNLHKVACCCLSLPIGTASVERSFSQMKLIKTRLRNRLGELSLSRLMKIAIACPETLFDSDLEEVYSYYLEHKR